MDLQHDHSSEILWVVLAWWYRAHNRPTLNVGLRGRGRSLKFRAIRVCTWLPFWGCLKYPLPPILCHKFPHSTSQIQGLTYSSVWLAQFWPTHTHKWVLSCDPRKKESRIANLSGPTFTIKLRVKIIVPKKNTPHILHLIAMNSLFT